MYRHLRERSVESGYMLRNFSELKSGGDNSYAVPPALKSGGGTRPPRPPPIDAREAYHTHSSFLAYNNKYCNKRGSIVL